jgi:hypothetical protein
VNVRDLNKGWLTMSSKFVRGVGIFIAIAGVLLGLALSVFVAYEIAGRWGVVVGILIFPFTFAYLPLYALFFYGSWNLLLVNYGSVAVGWILLSIAEKMEKQPQSATDEPPTQPVVTKDYPALTVILLVIGGLVVAAIVFALIRS